MTYVCNQEVFILECSGFGLEKVLNILLNYNCFIFYRFNAYTFTGLNKIFDHMDLDIDLLIFKINVQSLSCDFQKQNPFPFLNPDVDDIRNPA